MDAVRVPGWMWPRSLGRLDVEAGLRAGICVLVTLLALLLGGVPHLSAYVAFAAFTSLYGRSEAYRSRWVTVSTVGATFLLIIAAAMLVALLGGPPIATVIGLIIVSGLGVVLSSVMGWVPFGSVFFVFAFAVISSIPLTAGDFWPRFALSAGTVIFCVLVALLGRLPRRVRGGHRRHLQQLRKVTRTPAALRDPVVWLHAGETARYWFALLFITPLALLVGQLSAPAPVSLILTHRVLDTTIGGAVALVLVLAGTGAAVTWQEHRRRNADGAAARI